MSEKPYQYSGLSGGSRPNSGRKVGSLSKSSFKKMALKRLESAINNDSLPPGINALVCGLYLLVENK